MTPRERAKEATWDTGCPDWTTRDRERLELAVEQAITAAVEDDRRARPHTFVGRTDRYCELCNEPDRDEIHVYSRESVRASVEFEREACAKIAEEKGENGEWYISVFADDVAEEIRARSTASDRSAAPVEK